MKNYYQILAVPTNASVSEIKKAFRHAAMKYHPDKQKEKAINTQKFLEVHEAYSILSDERLRKEYDYELFLNKKTDLAVEFSPNSPDEIISETENLYQKILLQDPFRLNEAAFYLKTEWIFSTQNVQMIKLWNDKKITEKILKSILQIFEILSFSYYQKIHIKLMDIAEPYNELQKEQTQFYSLHKRKYNREKYKFWFVLALTIVICIVIYFLSK